MKKVSGDFNRGNIEILHLVLIVQLITFMDFERAYLFVELVYVVLPFKMTTLPIVYTTVI